MNIRYDKEIDAIYFDLAVNQKSVSQDEISDGVILDYDQDNNLIGIEVLDFQFKVSNGLNPSDLPFPEPELAYASQYFNLPVSV
jgi:uncharacterized protein YuzE